MRKLLAHNSTLIRLLSLSRIDIMRITSQDVHIYNHWHVYDINVYDEYS